MTVRESLATSHAQTLSINPPPCLAILDTTWWTRAIAAQHLSYLDGVGQTPALIEWGLDRFACPTFVLFGWGNIGVGQTSALIEWGLDRFARPTFVLSGWSLVGC